MKQAFDCVIYDTETATLLARNVLTNDLLEGDQRRIGLYRTVNGRYFMCIRLTYNLTTSRRDEVIITPLSTQDAIKEYNSLTVRKFDFKEAFPDFEFKEA